MPYQPKKRIISVRSIINYKLWHHSTGEVSHIVSWTSLVSLFGLMQGRWVMWSPNITEGKNKTVTSHNGRAKQAESTLNTRKMFLENQHLNTKNKYANTKATNTKAKTKPFSLTSAKVLSVFRNKKKNSFFAAKTTLKDILICLYFVCKNIAHDLHHFFEICS